MPNRFSLRAMFVAGLLAALALGCFTQKGPLERLRAINASFAYGHPVDSLLIDPRASQPIDMFLAETNIDDIEMVNTVWFSKKRPPSVEHFQLLSQLPNLRAIHLPGKFKAKWLVHLESCSRLELVSLNDSNANDESIPYLISIPSVSMIFVENTQVSLAGKGEFEKSGQDR